VNAGYEGRQRWAAARGKAGVRITGDEPLADLRAIGRAGTPVLGWAV
jgi:prephenate dehydrogenase